MFILSQDKKRLYNTFEDYIMFLDLDKEINYGAVVLGKYKTEEEAKTAFEYLINQIDEVEGVVKLK